MTKLSDLLEAATDEAEKISRTPQTVTVDGEEVSVILDMKYWVARTEKSVCRVCLAGAWLLGLGHIQPDALGKAVSEHLKENRCVFRCDIDHPLYRSMLAIDHIREGMVRDALIELQEEQLASLPSDVDFHDLAWVHVASIDHNLGLMRQAVVRLRGLGL